jgi:hypothetical protein
MKVSKIYFVHLRNEAHYQYLLVGRELIDGDGNVSQILVDLLPPFYDLIALEGTLVDVVRSSEYTEELADADRRRDRCIVGINSSIEAALHHFDAAVVQAAHRLEGRMKAFRGEIEKKAYEEESAAVKILVADFLNAYSDAVATVGIGAWVTELSAAQNVFEQLYVARLEEWGARPQANIKDVRREVEANYREIVERIEAHSVISPQTYDAFIETFNRNVQYFNEHAHHHARKDLGVGEHTVVEPIATQQYTEKAVTPLPKAYYREDGKPTVELVFAKDFSLTYKNNINVGTAEVTLHGKGAYKGQKTVTFNIAR